jgi:hypothetical protein
MTTPLTRPLFDNRLLRATGGPDLALTTRQGMGAAFQMPTLGDLIGRDVVTRPETFTEDQQLALREAERDRVIRLRGLEDQLRFSASDQERDALTIEIERLSQERKDQLQAATRENIEAGRVQAPEVLNEQYKDLGVTFDYAMSGEQAERIADARRAQMIQEAIMSRSPSGLIPSVAYFGAGLAAMATDPLEVATMFIPIVGPAGRAWAVGRLGRVGGRVAIGAVEGAAGQALVEPLMFGLSRQAQLDYTMTDSLLNVGLGLAFGGAVGGVAGAFARRDVAAPIADVAPPVARVASEPPFGGPTKAQAEIAIRQFANDQSVLTPRTNAQRIDIDDIRQTLKVAISEDRATIRAPFTNFVKSSLGAIDPDGQLAQELRLADITPRNSPGLFRKGGLRSADNIPAIEVPPEFSRAEFFEADADGGARYLSVQRIIDEIKAERSGGSQQARDVEASLQDADRRLQTAEYILEETDRQGYILRDRAELDYLAREVERGADLDQLLDRLARMDPEDVAEALAENAMRDPLADVEASRAIDAVQDVAIEDEIAEYEAMIAQIELSEEQAADIAGAAELQERAFAFVETARAAALCVART